MGRSDDRVNRSPKPAQSDRQTGVTYQIRTSRPDDWDAIFDVMAGAFHEPAEPEFNAMERLVFEADRSVVAERDGEIAGHAAAFTRDLAIPGGTVAAAHVTMVSVGATHRRQGLLTRMIAEVHAVAAARREPIAVLWASEGQIYQRYGYGLAAQKLILEGRSRDVVWRHPLATDSGRLRGASVTSPDAFRAVYESVWSTRPGWSNRNEAGWQYLLTDIPSRREGATGLQAVTHEDASGQTDGYLIWRVKSDWDSAGPNGQVRIEELVAATPEAYRMLWQFALSVDLTRRFFLFISAPDEPFRFLVTEPRAIQSKLSDALWLRILDLPAALAARRYAAAVDVVIEVTDERFPANHGRWHLVGSPDHAVCTPTDAPADLALDVHSLGAAYLGGTSLATLAAAGEVHEVRPGTLASASIAFGWHRPPSAIELF